MSKKKPPEHYSALYREIQATGVRLLSGRKNRVKFTPAEKTALTKFVKENGDFVKNNWRYKTSAPITKKQYEYINSQGGANFTAIKTDAGEYKVFARGTRGDRIKVSEEWEKIGRKRFKIMTVKKTGRRNGEKIGTREKFFSETNTARADVARVSVLEEAEAIFAAGGVVRVRCNGSLWSKLFTSIDQLEGYIEEQMRQNGGNLWAGIEVIYDDPADASPAVKRRRDMISKQKNKKNIRSKHHDE